MQPQPPYIVIVLAILLSLALICTSVWYLTKITSKIIDKERQILLLVVVFGFSALLGIYVCDKIIAVKINLLSEQESISIFNLIKDISLLVFGYYFGSKVVKS